MEEVENLDEMEYLEEVGSSQPREGGDRELRGRWRTWRRWEVGNLEGEGSGEPRGGGKPGRDGGGVKPGGGAERG